MTMEELKKMCRQKNISGYSKLNKVDLIKLYKKNSKGKKVNQNKTKLRVDNVAYAELSTQFPEHKRRKSLNKKIMKGGYKFYDNQIYDAVDLWCTDRDEAIIIYGHIRDWDVSSVSDMNHLFGDKENFNDDISRWNVSNVTSMSGMFFGASSFNQAIGGWLVFNVTNMSRMFIGAIAFNQPIGEWNVSRVSDMSHMFSDAMSFNHPIGDWNVSSETNMWNMFENSGMNQTPTWYRVPPPLVGTNTMIAPVPSRSIIIKKNILNSKNNTCTTKLYYFILKEDIYNSRRIEFNFEGQAGFDAGGLSRTVFDLFYKTYINNFFTTSTSEENIINILSLNNTKLTNLNDATNKLIILAKNANIKIYMYINDVLLNLLMSPNPIEKINLNKKNIYNKHDQLNNIKRKKAFNNKSITISNVITKNNNNKTWEKNFSSITNNKEKKEVYLRKYLKQIGFESYKQFEIMHHWIQIFWNPNLFTNKLSF